MQSFAGRLRIVVWFQEEKTNTGIQVQTSEGYVDEVVQFLRKGKAPLIQENRSAASLLRDEYPQKVYSF